MIRASIYCLGMIAASSSALAADWSPASKAPYESLPANVTTSLWTGFYAGVSAGAAYSDGEAERGFFKGEPVTTDVRNGLFPNRIEGDEYGFIGGGQVGYNHQFGAFVGGVEADFSFTDLSVENRYQAIDPSPAFPFFGTDTRTAYVTEFDNLGTVRARLGYAPAATLFYATGGLAYGKVSNSVSLDLQFPLLGGARYPNDTAIFPNAVGSWHNDEWLAGYTIGGGIEHKLSDSVSIKLEAIFVDLEDVNVVVRDETNFPGNQLDYHFDNTMAVGRIGVNFAF